MTPPTPEREGWYVASENGNRWALWVGWHEGKLAALCDMKWRPLGDFVWRFNIDDALARLAAAEAELKEAQETEVECIAKLVPLLAGHPSEPRIDKTGPSFVDGAGKYRARRDLSLSTACDLLADVAARLAVYDAAATSGVDETKPAPGYNVEEFGRGWQAWERPDVLPSDFGPAGSPGPWPEGERFHATEEEAIAASHRYRKQFVRRDVEAATAGLRAEVERLTADANTFRQDAQKWRTYEWMTRDAVIDERIAAAKRDERAATERDMVGRLAAYVESCATEHVGPEWSAAYEGLAYALREIECGDLFPEETKTV